MNGSRQSLARVPCTIVTGFLGAGKTTLIRHVLANAQGRRLAVIVNEFGDVGIDGEILKGCGNEACPEENIVELANGCLCCTVADEFVPALDAILARDGVEHIVIETSGLALPKPLVQAFHWPAIKSRVTVDGVVVVVDGAALASGRVADDLDAPWPDSAPPIARSRTTTRSRKYSMIRSPAPISSSSTNATSSMRRASPRRRR
jgi:cobalamin biosynthesis protein CobW